MLKTAFLLKHLCTSIPNTNISRQICLCLNSRNNFTDNFSRKSIYYDQKRSKYKSTPKKPSKRDDDSDSDEEDEVEPNSKVVTGHMQSLRTDSVLKAGLNMARNKVETLFYESRIRVNGKKIPKKSQKLYIEDEIDVIKGLSPMNTEFLNISRVVILKVKENEDGDNLIVKLKRYKNLEIENYPEDKWTGVTQKQKVTTVNSSDIYA